MPLTLGDLAYALHGLVPFRLMCALARFQGRVQHRLGRRERSIVRDNLEAAFAGELAPAELDRLTHRAFEYRQLRGLMLMLFPRLRPAQAARLFPVVGLEHLDEAIARGHGPVVVSSHLNSLCTFMAVQLLRERGYDIGIALPADADPQPASPLRRRLDAATGRPGFRERTGAFYAQFNVRPIVRRLASGAGVVFVGDGWHSAGFAETTFLGRPAYFTTGPASVARLTGSPVVPMFITGAPPADLRIRFEEPIAPDPDLDTRRDLNRMVTRYVERLEHHVRESIPAWQHWFEEEAFARMATLPEGTLAERYEIGPRPRTTTDSG